MVLGSQPRAPTPAIPPLPLTLGFDPSAGRVQLFREFFHVPAFPNISLLTISLIWLGVKYWGKKKTTDPSNCAASPFTSERDDPPDCQDEGSFWETGQKIGRDNLASNYLPGGYF